MKNEVLVLMASMVTMHGNKHMLSSSLSRTHWKETQSEEDRHKALVKAEAKRQRKAKDKRLIALDAAAASVVCDDSAFETVDWSER